MLSASISKPAAAQVNVVDEVTPVLGVMATLVTLGERLLIVIVSESLSVAPDESSAVAIH